MMNRMPLVLAVAALAGCATPSAAPPAPATPVAAPAPVCLPGGSPVPVAEMMFGRNIGGRLGVSEAQWRAFVDTEVTPRFPDGLSVLDAAGQWKDTDTGKVVREPSKLLLIVLTDPAAGVPKLSAIAEAYKTAFKQQAVMTMIRTACVSF